MRKNLSNYRKVYTKGKLIESNIPLNPINLFHRWFQEAEFLSNISEINAMSLSTIGKDGAPETRIVLLKEYNEEGFIFYTNYYSKKGKSIIKQPRVCLSFFWDDLQRQIIIKGKSTKIAEKMSEEYFLQRPKNSCIAAWSSKQSQIIPSRSFLEKKFKFWKNYFNKISIKRPNFWGGYQVKPYEIEFWQGRINRLHDRICYILKERNWNIIRRSP